MKMRAYTVSFQAGGVEKTISPAFDLDAALKREYARACLNLCADLKAAGLLKVTEREISGDYTRQSLVLLMPD